MCIYFPCGCFSIHLIPFCFILFYFSSFALFLLYCLIVLLSHCSATRTMNLKSSKTEIRGALLSLHTSISLWLHVSNLIPFGIFNMMHDGAPSRPQLLSHLRLPLKSKPPAEAVSQNGSKNQLLIMSLKGQKAAGPHPPYLSCVCFRGLSFQSCLAALVGI